MQSAVTIAIKIGTFSIKRGRFWMLIYIKEEQGTVQIEVGRRLEGDDTPHEGNDEFGLQIHHDIIIIK